MICRTCLRRAAGLAQRPLQPLRAFSTSIPFRSASAPSSQPASSQPSDAPTATPADSETALSSCPPGTVLSGLNYFKGKADPVAKADAEYPSWLWGCLETHKKTTEEADENLGDEFSKSRKQRRLAAKRQRKLEAELLASGNIEALAPKIPLQQQSINLPGGEESSLENAVAASTKREELRRAMRQERRAKIRESNYLKSM